MIRLSIPFDEKDRAKTLAPPGAVRWDAEGKLYGTKTWYFSGDKLPPALEPYRFQEQTQADGPERTWVLSIPFTYREFAKTAGAKWDAKNKVTTFTGRALPVGLTGFESPPFSRDRLIELKLNGITDKSHHQGDGTFTPRPHQTEAIKEILKAAEHDLPGFLLADDVGLGKLQSIHDLVMTPTGPQKIGALGIGETVLGGSTGKPQLVTDIHPQGVKKLYRVSFSDGTSCTAGDEHLWDVSDDNDRRRKAQPWRTLTTKKIREISTRWSGGALRWAVPLPPPLHFKNEKPLKLHPYLVGVLIGNGGLIGGTKIHTQHREQLELIRPLLPKKITIKGPYPSDPCAYSLSYKKGKKSPLRERLKELGLADKRDFEKTVPQEYLEASPRDRHLLLQGLLDTDGTGKDARIRFSSASETLTDQVIFLVRSLGGWATKGITPPHPPRSPRANYTAVIQLPPQFPPFQLEYHRERIRPSTQAMLKCITSIEPIGEDEAICISVDDPKNRYITNDFIVTHNTVTSWESAHAIAEWLSEKEESLDILVVSPHSAMGMWRETLGHLGVGQHSVMVINYEQLGKVFEIPALGAAKVKKGRKKKLVKRKVRTLKGVAKFGTAQEFDIIIWDESHYLVNLAAARTKLAFKLYEQPDFMIWMSATAGD